MADEKRPRYGAYKDKGGYWYLGRDTGGVWVDVVQGSMLIAVADYANLGIEVVTRGDWRARLARRLLQLNERFPRGGGNE